MKIQKVVIKNFKVIKDLEKEVNGANLILLGDNEVGKSSFIQAIQLSLGMIEKAPIQLDTFIEVTGMNGYKFKVTSNKDGKSVVEVTTNEGLRDTRKSALMALTGGIEFDIEEFVKLSESKAGQKKQVEIFKSLLPDEILHDLAKIQADIDSDYAERTDTNSVIKNLRGFIAESGLTGQDFVSYKEEKIFDESKLKEAQTRNQQRNEIKSRLADRQQSIEKIRLQIEELKEELQELGIKQNGANEFLEKNPEIDTSVFESERNEVYTHNSKVEKVKVFEKKNTELELTIEHERKLTDKIDKNRQMLSDAIKSIDSPVQA